MTKLPALLFIFICIFTYSRPSRADILYIDMDDAPDEINTAQTAANARGEKLVIFPARTPNQQKILNQIHALEIERNLISNRELNDYRQLDLYRDQLARENAKPAPDPVVISDLQTKIAAETDAEYTDAAAVEPQSEEIDRKEAALGNTVSADLTELQTLVASYQTSGGKITSIIFSGHHDFSSFTGILGTIAKADVAQIFASAPDVFAGVKAVYGMGCYSTTPAEAEYWSKAIPSVELLAGFDAGAPLSYYRANLGFLGAVLAREKNLRAYSTNPALQHDLVNFSRAIHALPEYGIANTAVCSRFLCVGPNMRTVDLTTAANLCTQKDLDDLTAVNTRYQAILASSSDSAEQIPCATQNSWLRTFNTQLRGHQHCGVDLNPLQYQYSAMTSNVDSVVRLIDFQEVYENFRHYFKADLDRVNSVAALCKATAPTNVLGEATVSCKAPPDLPIVGPAVSRAQIVSFASSGLSQVPAGCLAGQVSPADQTVINAMGVAYQNMIENMTCIPLSWVNPRVPGRPLEAPSLSCAVPGYTIGADGLLTLPQ